MQVEHLIQGNGTIIGVRAKCIVSGKSYTFRAKSVVLAAGCVESYRIVHNSNLRDESKLMGRGITDHNLLYCYFTTPLLKRVHIEQFATVSKKQESSHKKRKTMSKEEMETEEPKLRHKTVQQQMEATAKLFSLLGKLPSPREYTTQKLQVSKKRALETYVPEEEDALLLQELIPENHKSTKAIWDEYVKRMQVRKIDPNEAAKMHVRYKASNEKVEDFLMNIAINADVFLGRGSHYIHEDGEKVLGAIVYEFNAELNPNNFIEIDGSSTKLHFNRKPISEDTWILLKKLTTSMITAIGGTGMDEFKVLGTEEYAPKYASLGSVAHEVGSLRMGDDKESSVVDSNLKFWKYDNLYVCDLSALPFSPAANPSNTLVALALRLAHHLTLTQNTNTINFC